MHDGYRLTPEEIERAMFQMAFFKKTYADNPKNAVWLKDNKATEVWLNDDNAPEILAEYLQSIRSNLSNDSMGTNSE